MRLGPAVRDGRTVGGLVVGRHDRVVVRGSGGVGWTCRAPTAAPPPAPSCFGLFAVRHPSDSSCHDNCLSPHSPLGAGPLPLRSLNVSDNAELLVAAQVALNRHADVLSGLGGVFADAGHELYLVGGSVRDALLGRLGTDL